MKKRHTLLLVLSAGAALIILVLAAYYMKKAEEEFDRQHPPLKDPLQSEAIGESAPAAELPDTSLPEASLSETSLPEASLPETAFPESETFAKSISEKNGSSEDFVKNTGKGSAGEEESEGFLSSEELTETEMPEQNYPLPNHQIIFVGDSRTIGMQNALKKLLPDDDCIFVGKIGEGCAWFLAEGESEMAGAIASYPDAPVVLNFGVNDPDQIDQYLYAYRSMLESFPDTDFRFLSVNPIQRGKMIENGVSEEALQLVTTANITILNQAIQEAFPDRYLDSSTMLKTSGFETVDGLHYSRQTYLKIHRYVIAQLVESPGM